MNSVERRNLKKILDEEDGLTKAAIRELPSNSKEDSQKKLKQQAVEILRKEHQAKSKILSNKSTKVQKNNKVTKPEFHHYLSKSNTVSKRPLSKLDRHHVW